MSLRRYATRLSAASLSPFCDVLLRFVRTMILSRLLSPSELGAAVALMSILVGCEMITDIGLAKFVMVSQNDARAQVVAAARQISIARAVLLAAAIALLAPILAGLYGASDQWRIVAWLGVVPLIGSFRNWRIVQVQKDYKYGAEAGANIGGQVAAVAAVLPAYALFHDERVMLISLIMEAPVSVILSYVLAPPERVAHVDPAIRRAALSFGLPLMANGIGVLVLKQLDQMIVANLFGLAALGFYVLVLNLAITPTSVLQMAGWKISLPFLSQSHLDDSNSCQASLTVILAMLVAAAGIAIPIGLILGWIAPLVYGPRYQVSALFSILAMLVVLLRFGRAGPSMVLVNHGQTGRMTAGNLIASIGMLVGFLLGAVSQRLEGVLAGLVIGDLLSFVVTFGLLYRFLPMAAVLRHAVILGSIVTVAALGMWLEQDAGWMVRSGIAAAAMIGIGVDAVVIYSQMLTPFAERRLPAPSRAVVQGGRPAKQVAADGTAPGYEKGASAVPTDSIL